MMRRFGILTILSICFLNFNVSNAQNTIACEDRLKMGSFFLRHGILSIRGESSSVKNQIFEMANFSAAIQEAIEDCQNNLDKDLEAKLKEYERNKRRICTRGNAETQFQCEYNKAVVTDSSIGKCKVNKCYARTTKGKGLTKGKHGFCSIDPDGLDVGRMTKEMIEKCLEKKPQLQGRHVTVACDATVEVQMNDTCTEK